MKAPIISGHRHHLGLREFAGVVALRNGVRRDPSRIATAVGGAVLLAEQTLGPSEGNKTGVVTGAAAFQHALHLEGLTKPGLQSVPGGASSIWAASEPRMAPLGGGGTNHAWRWPATTASGDGRTRPAPPRDRVRFPRTRHGGDQQGCGDGNGGTGLRPVRREGMSPVSVLQHRAAAS